MRQGNHTPMVFAVLCAITLQAGFVAAQETHTSPPPAAVSPEPCPILQGPVFSQEPAPPGLTLAQPEATERALPINLATALRLAGARPLIIAAAEASVNEATAVLARARATWLPSLDFGGGWYHHDGVTQGQSGNFYNNSKDQAIIGGGLSARMATADALFAPLAARQVVQARVLSVQAARNDALLATAEAYFNVQQARGRVSAAHDVLNRHLELRKHIDLEHVGRSLPTDLQRGRAQFANFEDTIAVAREQWQLASADLAQVLRLDPTATVIPLEPPNLRVTLINSQQPVDDLIPIGLTNRPELASQQALVQAALARIRQERMRPLVPSLVLDGNPGAAGSGGSFMGGVFGSGVNGAGNPWMGRDDVSIGLVWEMQNLGFGNRALVRERRAQQQQAVVELFRIQDLIAAEIARAHAQVRSSTVRVATAERGLEAARLAYDGSREEFGKVDTVGGISVQVRRAFEVIDALRVLSTAYDTYFESINNYNRAQFRLYRALGYAAESLACERIPGSVLPVDTNRPPQMAPVSPLDRP
jgi:outer membrane protein TolC